MEKYHDWRDAFTGIHPFLPVSSGKDVLGLVRLPFFLVLFVVLLLLDIALPFLRWLWAWLVARPLLLVGGGLWLSVTQKGAANAKASVFFCNHKGYLDLLCAVALVAPSHYCFVFGDVMAVHSNLLSAFLFVVVRRAPSDEAKVPLSSLKQFARAVCFVEGSSSNHEKCVLALDEDLPKVIDGLALQYAFLHFSYPSKAAAFIGLEPSFLGHLIAVLSVPWQSVRVLSLSSESSGFEAGWEKLSIISGHKKVKLDWHDKNEFLEKWRSSSTIH